ncbi:hypothetical protein CK203_056737 [Vitis vinifera]|uniref:Uncharacterized protein n=1 Tax=Vitis vinifera TaxID=29760 RepID=A0A438GKG6_VITVI|nr:hypothetical protein CK203_056737 [Vitis vinifera]
MLVHDMVSSYYTSFYYTYDDFGPMRYQATTLSAHLLIETMTSIISEEVMHWRTLILMLAALSMEEIGHQLSRQLLDHHLFEMYHQCNTLLLQTHHQPNLLPLQPTISPTLTSLDPPSVQPPTSLDLPPLQPLTFSNPPLVQIDTSTQLDLPPAIPRVRDERPKRKRVPVTHRFSPCGGM